MHGLSQSVRLALWSILVTLCLSAPAYAAANCPQAVVANEAGNAFLNAARAESAAQFAGALDRYADMPRITQFALGRYRKLVPDARMRELVSLTERYVATKLADFAKKFRGLKIYAVDCRPDRSVKSRLEFGGGRAAQTVLWRFDDDKITDVNIQDAWLAQLLRTNFETIIQDGNGNIEALFSALGGN